MIDPLELYAMGNSDSPDKVYVNVDEGMLYGMEFETRFGLERFWDKLTNFKFGANLTLVHSEVDKYGAGSGGFIYWKQTEKRRELNGQSPYLANLDLSYTNYRSSTTATLHYNIFGKRLSEVLTNGTPDVYELPRQSLDFLCSQKVWNGLKVKLSVKNILAEPYKFVHKLYGEQYVRRKYFTTQKISLGVSYEI